MIAGRRAVSERQAAEPFASAGVVRVVAGRGEVEDEELVTELEPSARALRPDPAGALSVQDAVVGGGLVSETSFLRLVDLSFATVAAALTTWWEHEQRDGFVAVGPSARVGRIHIEHGVGRVRVVVRRRWGPLSRSLPMDLELAPWSELQPATRMELIARRRVRVNWRYFGTGQQALDTIIAELARITGASVR
jgi:hypothetical protein